MESIKSFLRRIDPFGVPFSFKFKSKENYTSSTGGLFLILFIFLTLSLSIYYFIPFYHRENITAVYYTLIMPSAERISFSESKSTLAFGFNCWAGNDGTTADQILKIDFKYNIWKLEDNNYKKTISTLGSHFCTKQDFYNQFNETFDATKIYNYQCLDDPSYTIEGIFTSEIFSYIQIEINSRNNSEVLLDIIDNYLLENDCKFQIFYSDNTIDIADYKNPIKSYIEASFIQINPTLSIRRNMYFMNQYLYDDDFLVSIFHDENAVSKKRTLFSRNEDYSLFQGLKRNRNYTDYLNYVKVFLRADTRKTEIKRKYQKITEFYADISTLLITIFKFLIIMFGFLNKFWGEQYLYNKLFFFQDFNLNNYNKKDKIKELIFITDSNKKINLKESQNTYIDEKNEKDNNLIKNFRNEKVEVSILKDDRNTSKNLIINSKNNFINTKSINNFLLNVDTKKKIYNLKTTNKNTIKTDKELINIEYEYYLSDYVKTIISKCKCYESKSLKIKNSLTEKASLFLNNKLDITLYIRNMILFYIMKDILLDSETKNIANFLVHPIISLSNNEENELPSIYNKYNKLDFFKFYQEIIQLSNKNEKTKEEIRLISLSNKHLKKLYN